MINLYDGGIAPNCNKRQQISLPVTSLDPVHYVLPSTSEPGTQDFSFTPPPQKAFPFFSSTFAPSEYGNRQICTRSMYEQSQNTMQPGLAIWDQSRYEALMRALTAPQLGPSALANLAVPDSEGTTSERRSAAFKKAVVVLERFVLEDLKRTERFSSKARVLEHTARLLQEKYGLMRSDPVVEEIQLESSALNRTSDLTLDNLDRASKRHLKKKQQRRLVKKHLRILRKLLHLNEDEKKTDVVLAVIKFLIAEKAKHKKTKT